MTLFDPYRQGQFEKEALLAARMCPRNFAEFVGQEHLVGKNSGAPFKHYYHHFSGE